MAPLPRTVRDGMNLLRISDRSLFAVLGAVGLLVIVNAALACIITLWLHGTLGIVAHTHLVLETLESGLAASQEAEAQQRNCLITGDMQYFELYRIARADAEEAVASLDELIKDNEIQIPRVATLREHLATRFTILEEGVSAMREVGFEAARAVVLSGRGKDAMDSARATVDQMRAEELQLLDKRTQAAETSRTLALVSSIVAGLAALLVVIAFARRFSQQIRERGVAAAALHAEKELFRTTLASIGDGVITTDTEARVRFVNSVAEGLTGWNTHDAAGQPLQTVFDIVNEDSRAVVENPVLRALKDGVVVGLANHTVLRARGGVEHPIDDSAAPIRAADGTCIGAVLVFRDVTARRDAERSLREADQRKNRFLALLSHELRNPLAPMRSSLELMNFTQDAAQLAQAREVLTRQLSQLIRLVDDLLDISRITSNKYEMRFEVLDIATVVANALEAFRPVLARSGQQLVTRLPDTPCWIRADPVRMAQVLYNLLNNASKFSDPGSSITLEVVGEAEHLVLRVRDEGVGIPPGQLERIFDMFEQVDQSIERSRSGLGIGLTLVRHLVEMHGGTAIARSEGVGRGSEIVVTLPAAHAPGVRTAPAADASGIPSRRILLADDNLDAAASLSMLLRLRGHEVRVTHDGRRALEEAAAFRPEVVLLDIGMPGQNGYAVARALRAQSFGREQLLVAVTGWSSPEDRRLSREAGFDHHLVKPVDLESIEAVLRQPTRSRS